MERVQARETLRGPIAVSLALRQRVITTIKINCGNYMNAYLVRQQQQRQVAKRMPSMLTTAVCVRPIGTQAISEWRVCESVLVLVVAPAAVLLLLLMVLPAVVERMSLALSEACGSGWFGTRTPIPLPQLQSLPGMNLLLLRRQWQNGDSC
uniref:HDC16649 n=1 Tax=Drosophila melanogaster TaxID=7227 RepID=Q6IIX2_DROME|nr:TPA_inf: HDC16649 [Drosophila melanogaster]